MKKITIEIKTPNREELCNHLDFLKYELMKQWADHDNDANRYQLMKYPARDGQSRSVKIVTI